MTQMEGDPLSIAAIAAEQQANEHTMQGIPSSIYNAEIEMIRLEREWTNKRLTISETLPDRNEIGIKRLAAEREAKIIELAGEAYWDYRKAAALHKKWENMQRACSSNSASLASRSKAAQASDLEHKRYGEG